MDRNSTIGLVLIFIIIITFTYINAPSPNEVEEHNKRVDSLARKEQTSKTQAKSGDKANEPTKSVVETVSKDSVNQAVYGDFAAFASGTDGFSVIENDKIRVTLSNKGGRVYSVELKEYKRFDSTPLVLLEGKNNEMGFTFSTQQARIVSTSDLYFSPSTQRSDASTEEAELNMKLDMGGGKFINQQYSLKPGSYLLEYSVQFKGMKNAIASNTSSMQLDWKALIPQQERSKESENTSTTIYYKLTDESATYLTETDEETEELTVPVKWISFKQHYFNSTLISDQAFEGSKLVTENSNREGYIKNLSAQIFLPYQRNDNENYAFSFYFGPNNYTGLKKLDLGMEKLVPLGWGIFGWINRFATIPIFHFLSRFFSNYGIIILLLTLIIKVVLFPAVYRSYTSMAKMRLLKPEMDEIKEKYADDLQRQQQENMKLYKRAGVNPLGGCLPMLLQMPVLIAIFQFFPSLIDLRQQSFLWATDLSSYDSILDLPFKIPFYGDHVSLWTLLMTAVTLVYTFMNNQLSGQAAQFKWISYLMPIMFLGIFNNYAAGFTYYSTIATGITILQQEIIKRMVDEKKLHAQLEENKRKPESQKKSAFQKRLEDMAKKRGVDPKTFKKK